jgi:hypothetical protein
VGESFATIGTTGLRASRGGADGPPRVLTKEAVRKIYQRALQALQAHAAGVACDLMAGEWPGDDAEDYAAPRVSPHSPFRPLPPPATHRTIATPHTPAPPSPREAVDEGAWAAFRDEVGAVAW